MLDSSGDEAVDFREVDKDEEEQPGLDATEHDENGTKLCRVAKGKGRGRGKGQAAKVVPKAKGVVAKQVAPKAKGRFKRSVDAGQP